MTYYGATTGYYSDNVLLKARLTTTTLNPVVGRTVIFEVGAVSIPVVTDSSGYASVSPIFLQQPGPYQVTASFLGDSEYMASSINSPLTISKEELAVSYIGDTIVPTTSQYVNVSVSVSHKDLTYGDITTTKVVFKITDPSTSQVYWESSPISVQSTTTPGLGYASAMVNRALLLEGSYWVKVEVQGQICYKDNFTLGLLTVWTPTGQFVTGGGKINDGLYPGEFSFVVRYDKYGKPQGDFVYMYTDGTWNYVVTSTKITGLAFLANQAFFEGLCKVTKVDPATGQVVQDLGTYKYRVDCWDSGDSGYPDSLKIRVYNTLGVDFHVAGGSGLTGYLIGGNITIHRKK